MNQLLESVIINPEARSEGALLSIAAEASQDYLPWSSIS